MRASCSRPRPPVPQYESDRPCNWLPMVCFDVIGLDRRPTPHPLAETQTGQPEVSWLPMTRYVNAGFELKRTLTAFGPKIQSRAGKLIVQATGRLRNTWRQGRWRDSPFPRRACRKLPVVSAQETGRQRKQDCPRRNSAQMANAAEQAYQWAAAAGIKLRGAGAPARGTRGTLLRAESSTSAFDI
jgi:hypothetical protein